MRLYSRTNAAVVDDPEFGHYEVSKEHGGFDFEDELSDRLHRFHFRGKPAWETEDERNARLHGEESERRRDPESLYSAVEKIAGIADRLGAGGASPEVAALSEQVAALTARLAELQAAATPANADSDGDEDAKPETTSKSSRSRSSSSKSPTA